MVREATGRADLQPSSGKWIDHETGGNLHRRGMHERQEQGTIPTLWQIVHVHVDKVQDGLDVLVPPGHLVMLSRQRCLPPRLTLYTLSNTCGPCS
jgi:hypothetical protein